MQFYGIQGTTIKKYLAVVFPQNNCGFSI